MLRKDGLPKEYHREQISPHSAASTDLPFDQKADWQTLKKEMYSFIANWAKTSHQFGVGNSTLTLYGDFPWIDDYEDLIAQQENPTIVAGEVPFRVIGKDITITDITNGSLLLRGKWMAGKLASVPAGCLYELEHQFDQFIDHDLID
jgi:hypothetical protein